MSSKIVLEDDKFLRYFPYILIASLVAPLGVQATFLVELVQNYKLTNEGTLKMLYNNLMSQIWGDVIPYHPVYVIIYILLYFWATLIQLIVPTFIMFFARAISFQYRKMIEIATNTTLSEAHYADMRNKGNKIFRTFPIYSDFLNFTFPF